VEIAMRIPSSSLVVLFLLGCGQEDKEDKEDPVSGEGTAAGDCTDGADNDADGDFDCNDAGCAGSPDCENPDENAAPSGAAIAIEPATPADEDDLRCVVVTQATDPNGDAVSYRYAWTKNGVDAGLASDTVAAALTTGGDTWTCTVTPTDGILDGVAASATVSITQGNRAPSAPTVSIAPAAPTDEDVLTCVIDTESVDPDGDTVTYAYAWSVNGADSGITGASVNAALTEAGQEWTCAVTASDGALVSVARTVGVTILAACAPDDHDCDGVSTSNELLTSCYAVTTISESDYFLCGPAVWQDGESVCAEAGVHLAALTSEAESTAVTTWLRTEGAGAFVWVGFNDIITEGAFEWTSGETFSYTNWHPGEPDNTNEPGDCGNLSVTIGDWWDGSCYALLPYVCESPQVE
jgi:hypothetical protein